MTAKLPGSVEVTPMIGAAPSDDATYAVSGTGHGKAFIRCTAGAEIAARMLHGGQSLEDAAGHEVMEDLGRNGGSGGVIAVDRHGNLAQPFDCEGMYRASVRSEEDPQIEIHE